MWSQRDHRASRDDLSAYLDGELEPRRVERLERHLQVCDTCRQELATLREAKLLLRQAPQRPLPRSFVLAPTVVAERRRYRLWSAGFVALRGAAVALSLALVAALSGNALLAKGLLPSSGLQSRAPQAAPVAVVEQPVAPEAAQAESFAADLLPTPTLTAPAAAQADAALLARAMAAAQPTATAPGVPQADAQAPDAAPQPPTNEPEQAKTSSADRLGPLTALASEPRPAMPTPEGDEEDSVAAAAAAGGADDRDTLPPADAAPNTLPPDETTPMPTPTEEAMALPQAMATPTEAPPTPTALPLPTATPGPIAVVLELTPQPLTDEAEVALAAPEPTAAEQAAVEQPSTASGEVAYGLKAPPVAPAPTAADTLRQGLSAATGVLLGVLLMVVGGLVWTGHMRRR